jgi:hypothetical protein
VCTSNLVPKHLPALCNGPPSSARYQPQLPDIRRAIAHARSDPISTSGSSPLPLMSGGTRDQERPAKKKLEWDWGLEHQDRAKETKADRAVHHAQPFLVDRRVLRDVVKEKFRLDVARIVFLSSGASHNLRNSFLVLMPLSISQAPSIRYIQTLAPLSSTSLISA